MQDLKVVGVESGALILTADDGARYRIAVDEALSSQVRHARADGDEARPKVPPREIQAHIRSGMSAHDVAELTGVSIEYVTRFEGPIVAEREHIVSTALGVPVHASDVDPLAETESFGTVIRERLASLNATGERWASWKDPETGWILKLEFTADEIDHDARWAFDARALALKPLNPEAITLSQQGEIRGGLIPRLRAVTPRALESDDSRFDSGAFAPVHSDRAGIDRPEHETPVRAESRGRANTGPLRPVPMAPSSPSMSGIHRADDSPRPMHQTADLLEALRKRRGERETAGSTDELDVTTRRGGGLRAVDIPLDDFDGLSGESVSTPDDISGLDEHGSDGAPVDSLRPSTRRDYATAGGRQNRRGSRAAMPSWDEIVFGARTDDDPA